MPPLSQKVAPAKGQHLSTVEERLLGLAGSGVGGGMVVSSGTSELTPGECTAVGAQAHRMLCQPVSQLMRQ